MGSSIKKEEKVWREYIDCARQFFVCVFVVLCAYRGDAMNR
jgi:hypothetical protein